MYLQDSEAEGVKKRSFKRSKSVEEQARRVKERNRRAQQVAARFISTGEHRYCIESKSDRREVNGM